MLSRDEAEKLFREFMPDLRFIVLDSWKEWLNSGKRGVWSTNRGRAVFMWEEMMVRAKEAFSTAERVRIHRHRETFAFVVDDRVLFRIKKGDSEGFSRNYPTSAALDFLDPEQELPGLPQVERLDLIYQVNHLEDAIADIQLIARYRENIRWSLSLLEGDSGLNVVHLPIAPATPPTSLSPMVRVKSDIAKKSEEQE